MAKEVTVYFKGPVLYANVFPWNMKEEDGKYTKEGGEYTIMLGLDDDDAELMLEWNDRYIGKDLKYFQRKAKKLSKDIKEVLPDGFDNTRSYFTFRRQNVVEAFPEAGGPPAVFDANGNEWPDKVAIGNGSVCTLKLNVFSGKSKNGDAYTRVRLDGIRVDEHVPYETDREPVERGEAINRSGSDDLPF